MNKNEILEIESKKNNYEYENKVLEKSNIISLIVIFLFITIFSILDFINKEPFNNRNLLLLGGSFVGSYLYRYIKLKKKEDLFVLIVLFIGLLLNLIIFIIGNLK